MTVKTITSLNNQRVKDAVKLRDARQRARQGHCLVEGTRELLQALAGGARFVETFVCPPLCASPAGQQLLARLEHVPTDLWHVVPEVFRKLAFGQRHEGVVAVIETPCRTLAELQPPPGGLIAVLQGLEKPGNVGAVLRSADAAGVAAVIVADPGTDLFNPNCIRASLGTIFTLRVCEATSAAALAWLRVRKSRIFAARLDAEQNYTQVDLGENAAIVLGSEAAGLSGPWQDADIQAIKLPMRGTADSLNVSATAAVLFYEALRGRG